MITSAKRLAPTLAVTLAAIALALATGEGVVRMTTPSGSEPAAATPLEPLTKEVGVTEASAPPSHPDPAADCGVMVHAERRVGAWHCRLDDDTAIPSTACDELVASAEPLAVAATRPQVQLQRPRGRFARTYCLAYTPRAAPAALADTH